MQIGIIGLPYVGKTTLFNALTGAGVDTGSYSAGHSANIATVKVPDDRLTAVSALFKSRKTTPVSIEYLDFVGMKRGAVEDGEFDKSLLAQLRNMDMLVHVVRAFHNDLVPHIDVTVDPARDIETIDLELSIADLQIIEKRLESISRELRARSDSQLEHERDLLLRCQSALETEKPLRELELSGDEEKLIRGFQFLTRKPMLIVLNVDESDIADPDPIIDSVADKVRYRRGSIIALCAKIEMEIAQLEEEDAGEFLDDLGLSGPVLDRMIRASYDIMNLITFLTGSEKETRAWMAPRGIKAAQAAGLIHSDMERGFIRAEVINWKDLLDLGSLANARQEGKLRLEGKEYIVQDGDVLQIRFNV